MLYRKMGKTNEEVSILGFGCMRLPVNEDKSINEDEATKMLRYAIDNGVNYVDTAWPYHRKESEPFVGRALQNGYREKVFLATKLPSWAIEKREDMDDYLNQQLEKLQTEVIDFYLIHALNKKWWKDLVENDLFDFMEKAKADGRINHIGFSFHDDLETFKKIVDDYDWEFCQIQYNYVDQDWQAGKEGLFYAAEKDLGIVIMEPLRGGRLTQNIPEDIKAVWNRGETQRSPAEWALRWLWNTPEISTVLSGMSTMAQVKENIQIANEGVANSLNQKELALVECVRGIYDDRTVVDCTQCEYCIPCPAGVNIPGCFRFYNDAHMFNAIEWGKRNYNAFIKDERKASNCIDCGECEEKCPQNIAIREELKKVVELFED